MDAGATGRLRHDARRGEAVRRRVPTRRRGPLPRAPRALAVREGDPVPPDPAAAADLAALYARRIEAGDPQLPDRARLRARDRRLRGTGKSEDHYRGWMSAEEARDGHDLIEWIAAQPWCDGNVGMVGVSYYGAIQLLVAATQPPHLKAIMPLNAPADFYREGYAPRRHHAGVLQPDLQVQRTRRRHVSVARGAARRRRRSQELTSGLAADPDLQMYPEMFSTAIDPEREPELLRHPRPAVRRAVLLGAVGVHEVRRDPDPGVLRLGLVGLRPHAPARRVPELRRDQGARPSS